MNSVVVKIWIGILLAAMGGYGVYTALRMGGYLANDSQPVAAPPKIVELKPGEPILPELADVKLVERSGANFRWAELEGQPWVANVFYATCQTECILISHQIRALQNNTKDVRFVSITCDPDRDSLDALQKYAQQYQADPLRWFFVRGEMSDIQRASQAIFGMSVERQQHRPLLVLMDADGKFVEMFVATDQESLGNLAAKIRELQSSAMPNAKPSDAKPTDAAASATASGTPATSEDNDSILAQPNR